jgi:hypothetical protein
MIGRLAIRSLTAHPLRSAVLAAGFGAGVGVMAILLGVAEIVLQQARAPALVGGGDVVVRLGPQVPARLLLSSTLQADALRRRIDVAAPGHTTALYLLHQGKTTRVAARGGIPSLERKLGDEEVASAGNWRDTPADVEWARDAPERVLRQIDRFHPVPPPPQGSGGEAPWGNSWAEWLYFNGRAADARFYMTILVGGPQADGMRGAGIRLQLDRNGTVENFVAAEPISEAEALKAPELTIAGNSVRLEGMKYIVSLDLTGPRNQRARGTLTLQASPGRLVPPIEIAGARGWRSGYVVPVMSGALSGSIEVDGQTISFDNGIGYHDHNWGFWQGVSWQWGQAQQGDLSLLYGRVFPPREAADPDRIPGFIGILGPDGPLGYATNVTITEENAGNGQPRSISLSARSPALDIRARFDVGSVVTSQGTIGSNLDFLQMRGTYTVSGRAGGRDVNFTSAGSAETFRGRR